ncbi:toll/interleukin-1 receptor domain-containing protein [Halomonas sp. MCCC 1A11036]|uniref:Toll/interleukin-1 receptor domain-containing protein n=1 Tax=Billgrantia zhangzhouensis TaxID=2733481 RepID=A0ABS9ABL2_9GAMM|nr:toll/interleukin-1 receptor domain-containing protein [Halomonas zhangzhouensis]MCE8019307.1 toll/interleukin-1 receptor domain-containing protein [Halomonas zhangzhouensis]
MSDIEAPKVFISYSHDSELHKSWVESLAGRLVKNGVDVVLDQWDLRLGADLPLFMEHGLSDAKRVLAVCTARYLEKANLGQGGVGYERMILTSSLMKDISSDRIIPIIRDNSLDEPTPTFLSTRRYIDFRDNAHYEERYAELIRDIHGVRIKPRPALGPNPFAETQVKIEPAVSFSPARYASAAMSGVVEFDYSNNNGCFAVGEGDYRFVLMWGGGSSDSIYAYSDAVNTVALAEDVQEISDIEDASLYDTSSRVRRPYIGDIVVWRNQTGYYAATKLEHVEARGYGSKKYALRFSYVIAPNKTSSFKDAHS